MESLGPVCFCRNSSQCGVVEYDRFLRNVTECTRAEEAVRVPAKVGDVLASSPNSETMLARVARPTAQRSRRKKMNLASQMVFSGYTVKHGRTE